MIINTTHSQGQSPQFDIAILGAGFAGTILGAILAKNKVRVLIVDSASHPKFALGESTVPQTTEMMKIIADRYSVPEIKDCSSFNLLQKKITSQCGVKKNFGFIYHGNGKEHQVHESIMSVIPRDECHLFRQDIDSYLLNVAISYGTVVRQNFFVEDIQINEHAVFLRDSYGESYTARYLVDSTGFSSVLAKQFALREEPTRLKTHSRSLFTHMIGVKPFDDCVYPNGVHKMPLAWFQGTTHHIFDGGWMWVIPFNNHKNSTNQLCSIGLNLDLKKFPKPDCLPEQEFNTIISNFPSISVQFKDAKSVRNWISTERLQYSSNCSVGDRFCLLGQSSASVDGLFSRGLSNTLEAVNVLADLLLKAIDDDDFSAQRFEYFDQLQQGLIDYNDRLVRCSYVSFSNFELWNAWYRIWLIGATLGTLRLRKAHQKYLKTRESSVLYALDNPEYLGSLCPTLRGFNLLFENAVSRIEEFDQGHIDALEAARCIVNSLNEADFIPPTFNKGFSRRCIKYDFSELLQLFAWSKVCAPSDLKALCF